MTAMMQGGPTPNSGGPSPVDFRAAAARNRTSAVYTLPWATGTRVPIQMHNDGYLSELILNPTLTVTVGTAGTVTDADAADSNYFPFMGIKNPDGTYIWTTNSRDMTDFAYWLYYAQSPFTLPNNTTWSPSSATAQPVNFWLRIPVSLNDGFNFDTGLIMRQLSNVFFYLELQMAAFTDLIGAGTVVITSITGNTFISETVYDAIDPNASPPVIPPSFAEYQQYRSLQSGALLNGQNDLSYAIGPVLTMAFLRLINNGKADGTVSNLSYIDTKLNQRQIIDHRTGIDLNNTAFQMTGIASRAGVYPEDFFNDRSVLNTTSGRDFLNTNKASQLDFYVQYAGTPSGTSFVGQFFRELVAAA